MLTTPSIRSLIHYRTTHSLSLLRLKATFHNASEPQAVWISTADVLRCSNDDQSHHATLLPIPAQKRFQIIKVVDWSRL